MLSNWVMVGAIVLAQAGDRRTDTDDASARKAPAVRAATAAPSAKPGLPPLPPEARAEAQRVIDKGLAFLKSRQTRDGGWNAQFGPAVTAIVAQAFARDARHGPNHPIVKRAVEHILRFEQPDGGIYEKANNLANYQTSVVLMLLSSLPPDAGHKTRIARAQAMLSKLQYDGGESIDGDNAWYGGAGYNEKKRPDLSNTQMMLEALHQSGLPRTDPVYQRALRFVSRCQMLGESNDLPFARGADDGGFIYSPNEGGESKASEGSPEGPNRLQCYGSMTYAGFKSMLYADVTRDDPRVKACLGWIARNYTLSANPNMPPRQAAEGLYYYYHVFAQALRAWGEPTITDARGVEHAWRMELIRKLASLQKSDGSWVNDQKRWLEGDPDYVTGLTVLTLQTAIAP